MAEFHARCDQGKDSTHLYRIVVDGQLHDSWSDWLGKVVIDRKVKGSGAYHTILICTVPDQAALRGLLNHLWDLNLKLVSVN